MKYILVTGGVCSGIGKGVITSSLGAVIKDLGLEVTFVKIDPYLNIDAAKSTLPYFEKEEAYVLDDGGEVDADLGKYERFAEVTLTKDHNVTSGKVYTNVINKERQGEFQGRTVKVVPQVTDAIQKWIEKVSKTPVSSSNKEPEVCIIELGGTVGEIESSHFVEAFRQLQFKCKSEDFCVVHVSLVPEISTTGEYKTKPTQTSVRELRGIGISPDFIVCRSGRPISDELKEKISNGCHVAPEKIICLEDVENIYSVPLVLEERNIVPMLNERLSLGIQDTHPIDFMSKWKNFVQRAGSLRKKVSVTLVDKYTYRADAYVSMVKALEQAAIACRRKLDLTFVDPEHLEEEARTTNPVKHYEAWNLVAKSNAILVSGNYDSKGFEGRVAVCNWARTNKRPFMGVCMGMQAAVIEFARNVAGLKEAQTQEIDPKAAELVVIEMLETSTDDTVGTKRVGLRKTIFTGETSKLQKLYGNVQHIEERHRRRYDVNPSFVDVLESSGMDFVGKDETGKRMEIFELPSLPYYVGVQYNPEYLARPFKSSPPYLGLIIAACGASDTPSEDDEAELSFEIC